MEMRVMSQEVSSKQNSPPLQKRSCFVGMFLTRNRQCFREVRLTYEAQALVPAKTPPNSNMVSWHSLC